DGLEETFFFTRNATARVKLMRPSRQFLQLPHCRCAIGRFAKYLSFERKNLICAYDQPAWHFSANRQSFRPRKMKGNFAWPRTRRGEVRFNTAFIDGGGKNLEWYACSGKQVLAGGAL